MAQQVKSADAARLTVRRLGKYETIARIGSGGMAEVYLARQLGPMNFQKLVVVKTIHRHLSAQSRFTEMLLDEARVSALLKHPHVVDIYDLGVAEGTYFIAMEYLAGETLASIIRAGLRSGDRLGIFAALRLIADCANGLHAAHELRTMDGRPLELVHRDVTPGNIIVLYTGQVKLVDFGVAKAQGLAQHQGTLVGKIGYAAPEALLRQPLDRRSDIYSLGIVLWETLTHHRLFKGKSHEEVLQKIDGGWLRPPSELNFDVPEEVDAICMRALARDPNERYRTASEMQSDIEDVLRTTDDRDRLDAIAHFMGRQFAARRRAREELLAQVASDDSRAMEVAVREYHARTATIHSMPAVDDAALSGPVVAPAQPAIAEVTPPEPATLASAVPPRGSAGVAVGEAIVPRPHGSPEGTGVSAGADRPSARRRWFWAAGGGALLAVLVLGVVWPSGGESSATAHPRRVTSTGDSAGDAEGSAAGLAPRAKSAAGGAANAGDADDAADDDPADDDDPGAPLSPDDSHGSERSAAMSAELLYKEGLQLFVQGRSVEAISSYRSAIRRDPSFAAAHRALGLALERTGDTAEAVKALRHYLKLAPHAADAGQIRRRIAALGG
jgi:eukaryotic-like serine/threonine-protein kinase